VILIEHGTEYHAPRAEAVLQKAAIHDEELKELLIASWAARLVTGLEC